MDNRFRQMAISAAKDLGLTDDEARREVDEYINSPLYRKIKREKKQKNNKKL